MQYSVNVGVHTLEMVWQEEFPRKPWRYAEDFELMKFDASYSPSLTRNDDAVYLSMDSIFFSLTNHSLSRLVLDDLDKDNCDPVSTVQQPSLVITYEEACTEKVSGSMLWSRPHFDRQLLLMPPTSHCFRSMDTVLLEPFLLQYDVVDAWIFHGDTGTGKTHQALIFAAIARMRWAVPSFYFDCKKLQSSYELRMSSMLQELTLTFREAMNSSPSVLVLDDLDLLVSDQDLIGNPLSSPKQHQHNPIAADQSKLLSNHLRSLIEASVSKVLLVITCRTAAMIPAEIIEILICHTAIAMESLSQIERAALVSAMFGNDDSRLLNLVSSLSEGYRPKDLIVVATRTNRSRSDETDFCDVVEGVMKEYVPLSRQGLPVEVGRENQSWKDVGGIFAAKEKLKAIVLNPIRYRRIYEKTPIKLPKGILLFGPPGCGKSFLIPALAKEACYTLITCRGPELLDRYIGASEANVRKLFERARSAAPAILFLDEFDALAPRRGTDNTGVTDRVVNQLLTYLDGVETTSENVFLIAATSRPDKIDPAVLRPGRLEQHIYVGFPESTEELWDVMFRVMAQRSSAANLLQLLKEGSVVLNSEEFFHLSQLTPADIKAVLDTAHLEAIHEHLASSCLEPIIIKEHNFRKALINTGASVSKNDRDRFDQIFQPFLNSTHKTFSKEFKQHELKMSLR